jgi:hypothetical protein
MTMPAQFVNGRRQRRPRRNWLAELAVVLLASCLAAALGVMTGGLR